ncbi:hypothetical protein PRIPAC_91671 [Pristionchus pacificus]|uniref:Uncharacterized protein n=1 Tax=Pristionchus pacificus TaxID=54126 RepID=A0A2A6CD73_PRIPA|nr:hypothetical protein PRIPAC_91671 [Pristionchus pacificus]|eukprot:PDM76152.1 hypothetical protein PRIPAC_39756 [Pristionchus pacificus]
MITEFRNSPVFDLRRPAVMAVSIDEYVNSWCEECERKNIVGCCSCRKTTLDGTTRRMKNDLTQDVTDLLSINTFWLLFDDPHDEIPHNEDEIVEDEKTRKLEEENQRLKRERDQLAAREAEVERKYRRLLIKVGREVE